MPSLEIMNIKIDKQSGENQPLYQEGKTLFQQQKFHQAERIIHSLIEKHAANANYFHLMSKIKASLALYSEQIDYLNRSLERFPYLDEYLIELAFAHLSSCNFSEAYEYAEQIAKNDSKNAEIYSLTAKVYNLLGEYNGSVAMLKKAIELDDANYQLFYDLGVVLTLCGKIKLSIDAYQKSICLNPDFGLAHAALTKARKASIDNNNIDLLKSLAIKHRNPWTGINLYHGLAKELDDLGKYQESFEAINGE